jgi:hypothetical protein
MLDALHGELENMGIDWRARNIVFRGWRTSRPPIRYPESPGTGAGRYLTLTPAM